MATQDYMRRTKRVQKRQDEDKSVKKPKYMLTVDDQFKIADLYFKQNNIMYSHLYNSFDKFIDDKVKSLLRDGHNQFFDRATKDKIYRYRFKYDNIRIMPPKMETEDDYMFPIDARTRSMTYASKLIATITQIQEIEDVSSGKITEKVIGTPENEYPIATIPIMVRSKYCTLNLKKNHKKSKKECEMDPGGYFIVNGNEKVVISFERICNNKPLVFTKKDSNNLIYTVQVNSKVYEIDGISQIVTIRMKQKDQNMILRVPILQEIPIFILFRALGVESDKDIIDHIVYDKNDIDMINLIRISLENTREDKNSKKILTQEEAVEFLITKMRIYRKYSETDLEDRVRQKKLHLETLLLNNFLPHVKGTYVHKAIYLGLMIQRLLNCYLGRIPKDDRDNYVNKRVDLPGDLLYELFKQHYKKMLNEVGNHFRSRNTDDEKPLNVINQLKPNIIELGLKASLLTGMWGSKKGVAQMLNRLSFLSVLASLRRINSVVADPSTNKLTSPRHLHATQVGNLCFIETPEGQKVGLVKHLSLIGNVTMMMKNQIPILKDYLKDRIVDIQDIKLTDIGKYTRVLLNGEWIGVTRRPRKLYFELKKMKLTGVLDATTSIVHEIKSEIETKELKIQCDGGRLFRPVLRVKNNKILLNKQHLDSIELNGSKSATKISTWNEFIAKNPGIIEYIDVDEMANSMIAILPEHVERERKKMTESIKLVENLNIKGNYSILNRYDNFTYVKYTHCEIHPSLLIGVVVSNIPFCNHNQGPRNVYQYSQAKQAMGIYVSNYRDRLDISYILYHPQKPLVTTRAMKYIHTDKLPFGENAIVAIACYTGFNQEDSVILNQSGIDRGMYNSTSLKKKIAIIQKNQSTSADDIFIKPDRSRVAGMRYGGSYDKLNEKGYIPEETAVTHGDIVIGKISPIQPKGDSTKEFKDSSQVYKENVPGVVDKVFTGIYNHEGYEMIKMRIRSERIPHIGDKFCLTDDAEVLTEKGWIKISKVTMEDKVAILVDNKYLKYENPLGTIKLHYNGDMYKLRSQQVDLDVTMDHDLYVKKRYSNKFELVPAREVMGKRVRFKKDCINNYPDIEFKTIEHENKIYRYIMDSFLQLLGTWMSKKSNNTTPIPLQNYFKKYGNDLPDFIFKLSQRQTKIFLQNIQSYRTVSKKLADDIMRLAIHAGWSGRISKTDSKFIINIVKTNNEPEINHNQEHNEQIYKYNGNVYCLEVSSHVFMVRQNNKNVWVGNCCYTKEHEVLTMDGWKYINEITKEDKVASLINDALEYHHPLELQEYDYEGKMYVVESNQVSLKVTPNHRMYVKPRTAKKYRIEKAEDIYGKRRKYLKNVNKTNIDLTDAPIELKINNNKVEKFLVHGKNNDIKLELDIEPWLVIFGIWIAEGCVTNSWNEREVRIATNKPRVKNALEEACDQLDLKIRKHKDKKEANEKNSWRLSNKDIAYYLDDLSTNATDKHLPKWCWYLSMEQSQLLLSSMILGDGHYMKKTTTIRYDTSSKQLRDDFQRLCLHAGYSANWYLKYEAGHQTIIKNRNGKKLVQNETVTSTTDAYRLTVVKKQNQPLVNKNITRTGDKRLDTWDNDYEGQVYCCTVPGDGVIYVRYNGKTVWCGNSRHGQKGTIGLTLPQRDMPFTSSGITPDIIMNPNAIPSRMTIGQLLETLFGKAAALEGREFDGTPFGYQNTKIVEDILKKHGYDEHGYETLYNGMTGHKMRRKIFIGPTYYQRLKHLVDDKKHGRARGPLTLLVRQPPEGRSRDGGLRSGEMERDVLLGHGIAMFLKERFLDVSDAYITHICDLCGLFAKRINRGLSHNRKKDIYECISCKNSTKISRIRIPYAFKLLVQELMAMCIAPRIRVKKDKYTS